MSKQLQKDALEWWDSLEREEQDNIEREQGIYGHDEGTTVDEVVDFYKVYKLKPMERIFGELDSNPLLKMAIESFIDNPNGSATMWDHKSRK